MTNKIPVRYDQLRKAVGQTMFGIDFEPITPRDESAVVILLPVGVVVVHFIRNAQHFEGHIDEGARLANTRKKVSYKRNPNQDNL